MSHAHENEFTIKCSVSILFLYSMTVLSYRFRKRKVCKYVVPKSYFNHLKKNGFIEVKNLQLIHLINIDGRFINIKIYYVKQKK